MELFAIRILTMYHLKIPFIIVSTTSMVRFSYQYMKYILHYI